ncbi:MAG: SCO family protein [Opitutales bacterium]
MAQSVLGAAFAIEGEVLSVDPEAKSFAIEVLKSGDAEFAAGETASFRVGSGDLEIGYLGRRIRANAAFYNKSWHLEQIFPLDGDGADAVAAVNRTLRRNTSAMKRGKFLREGDAVPDFGMIDQNGEFVQIKDLRGKAFVLNFIFTRCAAPKMCPASSTKMEKLQEKARDAGLSNLHFVTISFDPPFDSPGILRSYAKGYGMELENYHLLTNRQEVIDDLLRQFGILTIKEDGTINHTMATLLVDASGRVAFREEGPSWKVANFLEAAQEL